MGGSSITREALEHKVDTTSGSYLLRSVALWVLSSLEEGCWVEVSPTTCSLKQGLNLRPGYCHWNILLTELSGALNIQVIFPLYLMSIYLSLTFPFLTILYLLPSWGPFLWISSTAFRLVFCQAVTCCQ